MTLGQFTAFADGFHQVCGGAVPPSLSRSFCLSLSLARSRPLSRHVSLSVCLSPSLSCSLSLALSFSLPPSLGRWYLRVHKTERSILPEGLGYRGTSLIRNSAPVGPYSRTMPRALWWFQGGAGSSYKRGTPVGGRWVIEGSRCRVEGEEFRAQGPRQTQSRRGHPAH